ncbi:MAG: PAS domain-containing sensor histidine kinase, partial [Myxococcota bacterium]
MERPEGEALCRAVFEQAAVGVALIETLTGRYLRVNQSHCDLIGYTREETEQLDFLTITHPDDLEADLAQMERLKAGAIRSFTLEKRYFRKDGSIVWVSLTVSPLWPPGSPPSFHVAIIQDITERKRTEQALRDSEELFEQFLEHSPIYVFFKDHEIRSLRLSRNYEKMLGRPLSEILGKTMDDLFPSDLAKSMIEDDKRILDEGAVVEVHEELNGRHFHTVKFPIHREGKPLYLGGFTIDTTERMKAEAALRESEERHRRLYNDTPVMLHSVDAAGRLIAVSDRWLQALGYEREQVIGHRCIEFLTESSRKYAEQVVLPSLFETQTLGDVQVQFVKRNGEVMDVVLSAVAERDAAGNFLCSRAALIDVTERNRMEEALRQSQKMESVGRLAGGIAHDFNNLLLVILGHAELALLSTRPGDPLNKPLGEMQKAGKRAAELTQQLLAFSRRQVLQPRTVDLNEIVVGVESMLRRLIGEDIQFSIMLAPDLGLTRADPGQLEQVIFNLVVNARESMPEGGKLTIETANTVLDAAYTARNADMKPGDF